MRSLWMIFSILLLLHVLAAAAFVGWLRASGRLNQERFDAIVDLLKPTIEEEQEQLVYAQKQAEEAAARAKLEASLERVADGPKSFDEDLKTRQHREAIANLRADRVAQEIKQLRDRFAQAERIVQERMKAVQDREKALMDSLEAQKKQLEDADFKLALAMYEGVKPRQAKQMFDQLIAKGEMDQVVSYLAAMQPRKSAGVLKEFKEPADIATATQLVEKLRQRGVNLLDDAVGSSPTAPAEPPVSADANGEAALPDESSVRRKRRPGLRLGVPDPVDRRLSHVTGAAA